MTQLWNTALKLKIWKDSCGQDLAEFALAAGFVAGAAVACSPVIGGSVCEVFGKVAAQLQLACGDWAAPTN